MQDSPQWVSSQRGNDGGIFVKKVINIWNQEENLEGRRKSCRDLRRPQMFINVINRKRSKVGEGAKMGCRIKRK